MTTLIAIAGGLLCFWAGVRHGKQDRCFQCFIEGGQTVLKIFQETIGKVEDEGK